MRVWRGHRLEEPLDLHDPCIHVTRLGLRHGLRPDVRLRQKQVFLAGHGPGCFSLGHLLLTSVQVHDGNSRRKFHRLQHGRLVHQRPLQPLKRILAALAVLVRLQGRRRRTVFSCRDHTDGRSPFQAAPPPPPGPVLAERRPKHPRRRPSARLRSVPWLPWLLQPRPCRKSAESLPFSHTARRIPKT